MIKRVKSTSLSASPSPQVANPKTSPEKAIVAQDAATSPESVELVDGADAASSFNPAPSDILPSELSADSAPSQAIPPEASDAISENEITPVLPLPGLSECSLGGVVQEVIGQSFKRADRFRSAIGQGEHPDPEDIHQMRVSLRQLRSCLQAFSSILILSKPAQEGAVKSLAKQLGGVRDLDILQEQLKERYLPHLPESEQAYVLKILRKLNQKRNDRLRILIQDLKSDRYRQLKRSYREWLRSPQFRLPQDGGNAHISFSLILPDLLLPLLSQLLQHPGWFVGTRIEGTSPSEVISDTFTIADLQAEETQVHDLRKTIKQMRYQIALLTPFTESDQHSSLTAIAADLKHLQESLGALQDLAIIRGVLRSFLARKGVALDALAHCFTQLDEEQWSLWQGWQPIQERYLNPAFRCELRQQFAQLR